MSFFLFLLVNASLFIRPAEVVPALLGWKIYEALIVACLVASAPDILDYFWRRPLGTQPITLCVFGLLLAVPLSHLSHLNGEKALETGGEFAKVVIYYVLLVSVVNTPGRLRQLLFWTVCFCAVMTLLALLRYHGVVEIALPPAPQQTSQQPDQEPDPMLNHDPFAKELVWDANKHDYVELRRLVGTGIFKDPNDLCLAVILAVPLCLYGLMDPRLGIARLLLLPALGLFLVVLYYTYSRGGFLGFCAGLATLFYARYGWRKSLVLGALALPVLLALFAGRMTTIDTRTGTGQERIQLWSEWLQAFRTSPVLGVGPGAQDVHISHLAHNAFLQAYADLGMFGGILFVGAFYFAALTLVRAGQAPAVSEEMRRLRPYLLAVVAGSIVALLTLSQTYLIPTYFVLGLATVYSGVALVPGRVSLPRCDVRALQRVAIVGLAGLAAIYLFMRVFRA
jgi:hypothetical protein